MGHTDLIDNYRLTWQYLDFISLVNPKQNPPSIVLFRIGSCLWVFVSGNCWLEQIEPKLQIQTYLTGLITTSIVNVKLISRFYFCIASKFILCSVDKTNCQKWYVENHEVECAILVPTVVRSFNRTALITSIVMYSNISLKEILLAAWLATQRGF